MRSIFRRTVLLTGAMLMMMIGTARSQSSSAAPAVSEFSADAALSYAPEYARIVNQNCSCFWLQGGGADVSLNFYRGLGIDVDLVDGVASNIQPNTNLAKFTFAVGPRYTWDTDRWKHGKIAGRPSHLFVQSLFGLAHGYSSVFPSAQGTSFSATSYSIQFGGGADLSLPKHFGIRVAELDWVHTALPNASSGTQDDLRLSFGVTYRFKK